MVDLIILPRYLTEKNAQLFMASFSFTVDCTNRKNQMRAPLPLFASYRRALFSSFSFKLEMNVKKHPELKDQVKIPTV